MCVIIAKPRHIESPEIETFQRAMQANPHGSSIALKTPGKPWRVFKTMKASEMIEFIENEGVLNKQSKWVFHARIKTHGSAGIKNCHCWRDKKTDTIFAHNGTFSIAADKDKTDSETFFRHVFVPIYKHEGFQAAIKACKMIVNNYSKIAVIMEKEKKQVALVGNWIKQKGIFYSNTSAFPIVYASRWKSSIDAWDEEDYETYWNRKSKSWGQKLCNTTTTTPLLSQETLTSTEKPVQTSQEQLASRLATPMGLLT